MATKRAKKTTKRKRATARKSAPRKGQRATAPRNPPGDGLTQAAVARALGVTTRQIHRWREMGLPSHGEGRRLRLYLPEVIAWFVEHKTKQQGRVDISEAKARRQMAEAERAEIKLAQERADLVSIEVYESELDGMVGRLAAVLKSFPSRWSPQLVGSASPGEVRAMLGRGVRELMDDLRKVADDMPPAATEPAAGDQAV